MRDERFVVVTHYHLFHRFRETWIVEGRELAVAVVAVEESQEKVKSEGKERGPEKRKKIINKQDRGYAENFRWDVS